MFMGEGNEILGAKNNSTFLGDADAWKSRKLIARTISPTPSLFVAQRPSTYSQGIGKFWGD